MGKYVINGGKLLEGEVLISGAKNSVLPMLAASILNDGITILKNVPVLSDTLVAINILKALGASVFIDGSTVIINAKSLNKTVISKHLSQKMRSSIIFLGSLIAKYKNAKISYPGGCKIGKRPIDFHLDAFKQLNITIEEDNGFINAYTKCIKNDCINLPFASVGTTQNIILASIFTKGETIIKNAAREPEITDLQNFLNKMGANVTGAGTSKIKITGVKALNKNFEYKIIPDRIEAGTFLCLAGCTKSNLIIKNVIPAHLNYLIHTLKKMGLEITTEYNKIAIKKNHLLNSPHFIKTAPYPLFPTDLQPIFTVVLALSKGKATLREDIFENRNMHIFSLNKMGANIIQKDNKFIIKGVKYLNSANLFAKDLRGGAALITAGLSAFGQTTVNNSSYIKRGYENIEKKLQNIGGDIKYIKH